mmetsp:Transcript_50888/g.131189  ORF Transcript_50888/g.131189 Transcript_50888/m.131189 type:complete len:254 (+) Transcript_50888:180-941(+)
MSTDRLLMTSVGCCPSLPGCSLKAKATDILSALASATPSASMKGKAFCFTLTLSFRKCALMSQALTCRSSWSPAAMLPNFSSTFSFRNEKSEKLMLLISQSHPLSLPVTFSIWMAGRILRMKSRQVSFRWLTSASRASAFVSALSARLSSAAGSMPWSDLSSSRSMSSFSRCSMTFATVPMPCSSCSCVSIVSPCLTSSVAPLTTVSSSRLLTMASLHVPTSWLAPAACASRSLRIGSGTSMSRSPSMASMPW